MPLARTNPLTGELETTFVVLFDDPDQVGPRMSAIPSSSVTTAQYTDKNAPPSGLWSAADAVRMAQTTEADGTQRSDDGRTTWKVAVDPSLGYDVLDVISQVG
jgi:hypothetical protein